jgi:hypothetical protein
VSQTLRVFVNGSSVDVNVGARAVDCVRAWQTAEADAVASGRRVITDSRGLPISPDSSAHAGSIYRTVANRSSEARSE